MKDQELRNSTWKHNKDTCERLKRVEDIAKFLFHENKERKYCPVCKKWRPMVEMWENRSGHDPLYESCDVYLYRCMGCLKLFRKPSETKLEEVI